MKRILAIDGGGIRGVIPAVVLRAFEKTADTPTAEMFDMMVGTSTGGLICLGLSKQKPFDADRVLELFKDKGKTGASDSTDYVLKHCLPSEQYFRFQWDIPAEFAAMDDASKDNIEKLRALATNKVMERASDISIAVSAFFPPKR